MTDRTRERALLLLGARRNLAPGAIAAMRELAPLADWDYLGSLCEAHLTWPLMLTHLQAAGVQAPEALLCRWRELMVATTVANMASTSQLVRILGLFDAHGISAVAWKGPTLAAIAYGSIGLRTSSDLDILVPRSAIRDVRTLMLGHGYVLSDGTRHAFDSLVPASGREYEFHPLDARLSVVETQVSPAPWVLAIQWPMGEILERSVVATVAGHRIRTLSPEDLLLAVALHGAGHLWSHLRLIADIDAAVLLISDWDVLIARARAARMERILFVALLLAQELFQTAAPDEVVAAAGRDRIAVKLGGHLTRKLFAPVNGFVWHPWRNWIHVRSRERTSDRLRYTCRQLAFAHIIRHCDRLRHGVRTHQIVERVKQPGIFTALH